MTEDIFLADPQAAMRMAIGCITIDRVLNDEAERLERVFGRDFIRSILAKSDPTWEDYGNLIEWCM